MYTTFHYTKETDNFTFTCFHVDEKGTDAVHTHMSVIFTPAQLETLEGMIQRAKDKKEGKE